MNLLYLHRVCTLPLILSCTYIQIQDVPKSSVKWKPRGRGPLWGNQIPVHNLLKSAFDYIGILDFVCFRSNFKYYSIKGAQWNI